jgi:drug/metabolite transporter (DMT)-like permease
VLIKVGLADIPPVTFAGLRYFIAFLCLAGLAARSPQSRSAVSRLTRRQWGLLVVLGFTFYTLTQGAQFVALTSLPAVTLSLMLNFTPVFVLALGAAFLGERPTRYQLAGIGLFLMGTLIYFGPVSFPAQALFGLAVGLVGTFANAVSGVLGRYVNRDGAIAPLVVTTVSMGVGSALLLGGGLLTEGLPALRLSDWALIVWLAVVHTALAFTLWNITLRTLSAVESSVINNTMLVQISLLAWLFLGETITALGALGLLLATAGILVVQVAGRAARRASVEQEQADRQRVR